MGFLDKLLSGGHGRGHSNKHGSSHGNSHGGSHGDQRYRQDAPRPLDSGWGASGTASPSVAATLVACGHCGVANDTTARFCQQCGKSLQITKCGGCNSILAPDAKFCGQCGTAR